MKISCLIIDDQKESMDLLMDHIEIVPSLFLKNEFTNPAVAHAFLDRENVDCIFLDIEMPQMTGLEFVEILKEKFKSDMPKVILSTGYDKYALSGYDYGIFDYLLKPVSFKRFKICVDRLEESLIQKSELHAFFFADVDGRKIRVNFNEILYVEGAGNYISIFTNSSRIICYKTMTNISEILPRNKFTRVHKSFIVSLNNINALRGNEIFILMNNKELKAIPIGITYKEQLLKILKINN